MQRPHYQAAGQRQPGSWWAGAQGPRCGMGGAVVAVLRGQARGHAAQNARGHAAQNARHTRAVLGPSCTLKSADMAKRNVERAQMKEEQPPAGDFWAG